MGALHAAGHILRNYGLAVVTGGSSGIGHCFVATLREVNPTMRICNLSRTAPGLPDVQHIACDFADRTARHSQFARAADWVEKHAGSGKLLLINNSGFGIYGAFPEPDLSAHADMIAVNVAAMVELTAGLLPALRRRGGAIINVASGAAFQPIPLMQTYAATKAFVLSWSVALAEELHASGVQVQALCPGPTRTGFQKRASVGQDARSDSFAQDPAEVVATSFRALRRDRVIAVSGFLNRVVAQLATHAPRRLAARFAKKALQRYRLSRAN